MDTAAVEQEFIYLCEFSPQLQTIALDWAKKHAFTEHFLTSSSSFLATSHQKLSIELKAFGADDARIPPYQTAVRVHGEVETAARACARALDQKWAAWREIIYTAIRCSAGEKERHRKEELQGESDKALLESGYKQFEWVEWCGDWGEEARGLKRGMDWMTLALTSSGRLSGVSFILTSSRSRCMIVNSRNY
jgi:hypothetical protein